MGRSILPVLGAIVAACLFAQREAIPMDEWKALDLSLKATKSTRPKSGCVPDKITAIRIGEAIAIGQWREMRGAKERPFRAGLQGGIWTGQRMLHPQGAFGATAGVL